MTKTGETTQVRASATPEAGSVRRDAIARQTSAWLFTLSEDANEAISHLVDQLCRHGLPQLLWQIRNDTFDESEDDGSKYRMGWNHGTRHSAWMLLGLDRNEIERLIEATDASLTSPDSSSAHVGNPAAGNGAGGGTLITAPDAASVEVHRGDTGRCVDAPETNPMGEFLRPASDARGLALSAPTPTVAPHDGNKAGGGTFVDIDLKQLKACADVRRIDAGLRELASAPVQAAAPGVLLDWFDTSDAEEGE